MTQFDYNACIQSFKKMDNVSDKKKMKFLNSLLNDEEFILWLFNPPKDVSISQKATDLYSYLKKPKMLKYIVETIDEKGYDSYKRSVPVILYSIATMALEDSNIELENLKKSDLSDHEIDDMEDKIKKYNRRIKNMFDIVEKMTSERAKKLSKRSNIEKYICMAAYRAIPDSKYIDKYKVGFHLNLLLSDIYVEISKNGSFTSNPKWGEFFSKLLGEENLTEVCIYILLEGVHRINQFQDKHMVKQCWNSLTEFALDHLNNCPESIRDDMLKIYLKRIETMFENRTFDLRVNLLNLDRDLYDGLSKTISKYADKIRSILFKKKDDKK